MKNAELALQEQQLANTDPISVSSMLEMVIKGGITEASVGALDKLCDLKIKLDDRQAERQFNAAFSAMQSEMTNVQATRPVNNKDGSLRYHFAPYEDLMKAVQPILSKHGFSVRFTTETSDDRLVSICSLMHIGGHKQDNKFSVRLSGPPGSSPAQADMSTKTYAKRGALMDALNIVVVGIDDDQRQEGSTITEKEAADLKLRAEEAGVDIPKLLKFAHARNFTDITSDKLDACHEAIDNFERKKR